MGLVGLFVTPLGFLCCASCEREDGKWAMKNLEAFTVVRGLFDLLLRVSGCLFLPLFVES